MSAAVGDLNGMTPMKGAQQTAAATQPPQTYGKISLQLTNCLLPEEKLSPTPSEVDGLDKEVEIDLRIIGCELIQTAGMLLKLPQVAMATAQVLFQRFYYSKSFVRHPMEIFAMGCLCLASKIEEAPRRVRDVINVFSHIKQVDSGKPIAPVVLDQIYSTLKIQVIKAERRVLKELGFCVHVKHPHKIIVIYLQMLGFEKNEEFMQCSWNYMNDSLRTNVFVRYDPETIACACVYLSAKKLKIPMLKEPPWYSLFGAKEDDLLEICYSILRLYNRPKANADKLERIVVELQTKYQEERARQRKLAGLLNSANNTPAQNSLSPSTPAVKKPIPEVSPRSKETRRSDTPSPHKHKSKSSKKHRQSSTSLSRSRSRSRDRGRKKLKSRNGSISPPHSPDYKRSHKSREKRYRSRSRSRDRRDRSRSRSYDRYKYHEKSKKHKYRDDASRKRKEIRR